MKQRNLLILLAAALMASAVASPPVSHAASEREIRQKIEKSYGVKVLKARRARYAGQDAFILTVMKPAGTTNDAFQITTLAVDSGTGKLIPVFRHGTSGPPDNQSPNFSPNRQNTEGLRQGLVWR